MNRVDRLFAAANRWEHRAEDKHAVSLAWLKRLTPRLSGNPMSRRLWCLRHARRCRTLGLRAMREAERQERLARYRGQAV